MSCTACDALIALSKKGHTCGSGHLLDRKFYLAAAALPALYARMPVDVLDEPSLDRLCAEAYRIADAMLRAEGSSCPSVREASESLLYALKTASHHVPEKFTLHKAIVDEAIQQAEQAGIREVSR